MQPLQALLKTYEQTTLKKQPMWPLRKEGSSWPRAHLHQRRKGQGQSNSKFHHWFLSSLVQTHYKVMQAQY